MAKAAPKTEPDPTPPDPDPGVLATPPQDPEPDPTPAPELVTMKIGGQDVQVEKSVAEAIQAQDDATRAEMDNLRRAQAPAPQQPAPQPSPSQETNWEELMINDPAAFAQKIREDVTQELTSQYTASTAMRDFWGDFYDKNGDLKEHKTIVQSVMNQNMGAIGEMPANLASDKLAELTRETIVGLVKQFGPKDQPNPGSQQRTAAESGQGPASTPDPATPAGNEKVLTMTDALRERRKARRKAGQSGTAA